jgi:hypothetical protein
MKVASSIRTDPHDAVAEVKEKLDDIDSRLLLFFASSAYAPDALAHAMGEAFGDIPRLGCTTAGELVSGKMLKGSLVTMALDARTIASAAVAAVDLKNLDASLQDVFRQFAERFGTSLGEMDPSRFAGIVLTDGLSVAEERLMEAIGDRTVVPFVGGSAGDDLKFETTHVFVGSEARSGASALAAIETVVPFEIIKTQSFNVLEKKLVVSRVNEATRTVYEFNGKPAVAEYAAAIGTTPDKLADYFMTHPLGLMVSKTEPFVRSPQQVRGDAVVFYCAVKEGMELSLLEAADVVKDTRAALDGMLQAGPVSGLVNFHCILRTLQLEGEGKTAAYGELFRDIPMIGFSTYGESYIGHINQTSTILVFR